MSYFHEDEATMRDYLSEIGRFPLLTPEQEQAIGRRIAQGDREAWRSLVNSNLRLVVTIARGYSYASIPLLDRVQDGNMGLLRAAEKFDYTKGFKFSTYATWWIRQAIERPINESSGLIRLPSHASEAIHALKRQAARLFQERGREPSAAELALATGLSVETVEGLQRASAEVLSLEQSLNDEDAWGLLDLLADESGDMSQAASDQALKARVAEALRHVRKRERRMLVMRYGLDGESGEHTLEECGAEFGLSKERVRQLTNAALKTMKPELEGVSV